MVDDIVARRATEMAWTLYRAKRPRSRFARRAAMSTGAPAPPVGNRARATERFRRDRPALGLPTCGGFRTNVEGLKMLVARAARGSARPARTLLAIAPIFSAAFVLVLQFVFGT